MAWVWWLAITLLLGVVEVLVVDLLFIMFAGGALAATVAAALGADIPIQVAVFGVVSVLLLVAIRPWALRRFKDQTPETATNVAAHVGRMAVVLVATSSTAGRVKLLGEVWSARFEGTGVLPEGTKVEVTRIDGATAVVVPTEVVPGVSVPAPTNDYPAFGGPGSLPAGPPAPAYPQSFPPGAP